MSEPKLKEKPFVISKWVVWDAYERVKANQGAAGVDGESIAEFERDLKGNLYKLWNRIALMPGGKPRADSPAVTANARQASAASVLPSYPAGS